MNIFQKIGNFFKSMFDAAIAACKALIDAALPTVSQIIIGQLKDFAIKAVQEVQGLDMENDAKRKAAFDKIAGYAKDNAIDAKDSLVNFVIELALQAVKNGNI
jgi:hypothetical protein